MTTRPAVPPATRDTAERMAYLREVGALLWPAPSRVVLPGDPAATDGQLRAFYLVPHRRWARLLVPQGAARAASAALRWYGEPRSRATRLASAGLALALRAGVAGPLLRDRVQVTVDRAGSDVGTIETHLARVLGHDVLVGLRLGPPRANRKPVLQIMTPDGRTVGFAKVGVNPLTRALVGAERDALRQLSRVSLTRLSIPRVLHFAEWNGLAVLVLSPLEIPRQTAARPSRITEASVELAGCHGMRRETLARSPYWTWLTASLAALPAAAPADLLRSAAAEVSARAGTATLTFGSWHGDWSPWNLAVLPQTVLGWDWERFATCVPMGFDGLHFFLQDRTVRLRRDPAAAADACFDRAGALLAPYAVAPDEAALTAVLYATELAGRYLRDGQAQAGARLGDVASWLLPALAARAKRL